MMSLVKLWLMHTEEVIARPSHTVDHWWFLNSASKWYWGWKYDVHACVRPPGYPLWVAILRPTGMPLRIGIELLQIAGAFTLVWAMIKTGLSRGLCLLLVAAIIFHPVSFFVNNEALADSFYAGVLLFALAGLIAQIPAARTSYALLTGAIFAVLWHTRDENILVAAYLAFFGLLLTLMAHRQSDSWRAATYRGFKPVLISGAVILAVSLAVKTTNYFVFGVFATSDMTSPAYEAANRALLRIRPPHTGSRFVPVTREVREMAYSVSPAFRGLRDEMDGENGRGKNWKQFGRSIMGVENDIAGGWFRWALRDIAATMGHHKSGREANDYYWKVAAEINQACDDGRLPSRFVFSSFFEPDFRKYLPYLPSSFLKITKEFVRETGSPRETEWEIDAQTRGFFDIMSNRRAAFTCGFGTAQVNGWVFSNDDPVRAVFVRNSRGETLASLSNLSARPDVARGLADQGAPLETGFSLTVPLVSYRKMEGDLVFVTRSGSEFVVPNGQIEPGPSRLLPHQVSSTSLRYAVDSVIINSAVSRRTEWAKALVTRLYGRGVRYLTILGAAAVVILLIRKRSVRSSSSANLIAGLLLFVVALRVALLTLMDATGLALNSARYVFPVLPLYTCVLLILVWEGGTMIVAQVRFMRRPGSAAPAADALPRETVVRKGP
jgi:hypothetical protein